MEEFENFLNGINRRYNKIMIIDRINAIISQIKEENEECSLLLSSGTFSDISNKRILFNERYFLELIIARLESVKQYASKID